MEVFIAMAFWRTVVRKVRPYFQVRSFLGDSSLGLGNHRLGKSFTSLDKVGKSNNDLSIFGENNLMLPRPYRPSSTILDVTEMWLHLNRFFCQITQGQISKNQDKINRKQSYLCPRKW